jgi:hypothetical protein
MADDPNKNSQGNAGAADADARAKIGRNIVYFALSVVGFLGFVAILAAAFSPANSGSFAQIKDIFGMLLPLLGTWVGTVLAFYFSKENFVAAAQQTSELVRQLTPDQKLQSIPVEQVMISMESSQTSKFVLSKKEEEIKLKADILDPYLADGKNRLPCVDANGIVKYVFHRSLIEGFISKKALAGGTPPPDLTALTLKDLINDDQVGRIATAFGSVGKNANLGAVKALIDGSPDCADVFVTTDGAKSSKAIGWITNVILAEKSKV